MRREVRDHNEVFDEEAYDALIEEHKLTNGDVNFADWEYEFVPRQLYAVVFHHLDAKGKKVIRKAREKCGFEAYRLLN